MQRLLAHPLLSKFSTVLPPLGEPDEEALGPALLPADSCRTAGIETNGSAQNSPVCCRVQQTSLASEQRFLDCGLSRHRDSRLFRAPGPPGDQTDDRLEEACGCRPPPRAAKTRPVPLTRLPLITRLLAATGSRHTTRPAHAVVGGHHTTVSSLSFIAYPQTRVPAPSMLGPYADATGRSLIHYSTAQTLF